MVLSLPSKTSWRVILVKVWGITRNPSKIDFKNPKILEINVTKIWKNTIFSKPSHGLSKANSKNIPQIKTAKGPGLSRYGITFSMYRLVKKPYGFENLENGHFSLFLNRKSAFTSPLP